MERKPQIDFLSAQDILEKLKQQTPPPLVSPQSRGEPLWQPAGLSTVKDLAALLEEVAALWGAGKIETWEARRRGMRSIDLALQAGALNGRQFAGLRKDLRAVFPIKMLDVTAVWIAQQGYTGDEQIVDHHALRRLAEALVKLAETPEPAADTTADRGVAGTRAKGMDWETAKKLAEKHCSRHPFPGVKQLAKIIGCSPATILKAFKHSAQLRQWRRKERTTVSVADQSGSERQMDYVQSRQDDPLHQAAEAELLEKKRAIAADPLLKELMKAATPKERQRYLEESPLDELRELAEAVYNDPDKSNRVRGRSRCCFCMEYN